MTFKSKRSLTTDADLRAHLDALPGLYQPIDLEIQHEGPKRRALAQLSFILKHAARKQLQETNTENLLTCSLALLYYYGMRIKLGQPSGIVYSIWPKRKFTKAVNCYQRTLEALMPEHSEHVMRLTLRFFSELELWLQEDLVRQLLEAELCYSGGGTRLFHLVLTDLNCAQRHGASAARMARHRLRVLYDLLNSQHWRIQKQHLIPFTTRLLDFFALSLTNGDIADYRCLRKGFVLCLKRTFDRVENCCRMSIIIAMLNWLSMVQMGDDELLEFGELLAYVAERCYVDLYSESLGGGFLEHVLGDVVGSARPLLSLVGCRLLQRLFDRQRNMPYLIKPTIYYEFSLASGISIADYDNSDRSFICSYRERLHDSILKAMRLHCSSITSVKTLAALVGCLVLEVPCGLTAAATACLLMAIQDFALNGKGVPETSRFWMHATVVSTMSLICWVHKAPVLYSYVNHIVSRRAKEAPHLNPPLMPAYETGNSRWNKTTLFFEDWELRYGLWKHFQGAIKHSRPNHTTPHKKMPRLKIKP